MKKGRQDRIAETLTLKEGYASIGFERGRNVLVKLNKFLVNKRMLVKEGKGYKYNPDFHY